MSPLAVLLIIVLVVVLAGGGYGFQTGRVAGALVQAIWIIVLILLLVWLLRLLGAV